MLRPPPRPSRSVTTNSRSPSASPPSTTQTIPAHTPRPRRRPPCGPSTKSTPPPITSLKATGNSKEIAFNVEFQPGNGWSKNDVVDYQWTPDGVHWGLPVQGWRSHRHQPGAHGWCRRNGPSQGDRPQGRHRYHIRSGGHRQHREFLRSALNRKSDVQRRQPSGVPHLQLGNANNGGREATLTAAYAGQEERLNWNDTAKSFYVGEGGTGTLCVTVTQTSEVGPRTAHECGNGVAPSYARSYSGFRGGSADACPAHVEAVLTTRWGWTCPGGLPTPLSGAPDPTPIKMPG